ncbi:MAG: 4-phosphoerythronate dehydrogenase PdxB [Bacteroidales bacterium]|nr:4-phosphoerythronate dehydrogenase PdxB [Bacteroidales bacterium]
MVNILADDKVPFLKGILDPYAKISYLPGKKIGKEILDDVDALVIRTRTKCTEELLAGSGIKFIGTATIGFDHIDTQFCNRHNIKWANAPGCNSSSVQQYMAAALLKTAHDFGFRLKDKTIGIVGVGNVGSKVEKFARVMGMNVLLNDPPRARKEGKKNYVTLNTLLHESDIITLHVPLNIVGDKTYHLFNENTFRRLKKGAWIFNTSRGEVIETTAFKTALGSGSLGGGVIDVWENEPDIDLELMGKAFITTPHIAGYSTDGKANGTAMIVNTLSSFFSLPIKEWYPQDVPPPPVPVIRLNGKGKTEEDIIREAVFHTYDIESDSMDLRASPYDFENLRGDYPIRREFHAYKISLEEAPVKVKKMLSMMGFGVL